MKRTLLRPLFLFALCAMQLGIGATFLQAQDGDPAAIPDQTPEEVLETAETKTPFPPGLDEPGIALEELQLRVLPLTAEELEPLAAAWLGHARAATEAVVDQVLALRVAGEAVTDPLRDARVALAEARREVFEKYAVVVASFEAKGGDPALIASLRAYPAAVAIEATARMTPIELAEGALSWLVSPDGGLRLALRLAVFITALFGLLILARMARGWARRMFRRLPNLSKLLQGFLAMAVYWLVVAFGLMVVLAAMGVNVTPLFALVGGASFILAFAMQDTLGNLASGLMIMINRPFDEGDYVTVAGVGGSVKHVSVVSTTVTTPDNQVIVIPNSKVWGDVITNVTASETRRVDLNFGVSYEDSIEQAQAVLEELVTADARILRDPAPVIRVNALSENSVDFVMRPWVRAEDYWDVYWDLTRKVKETFDAHGITIPFAQTVLRIKGEGASTTPFVSRASGQ